MATLREEVGLFVPFYDVGYEIPVYAHYCRRYHKSPRQRWREVYQVHLVELSTKTLCLDLMRLRGCLSEQLVKSERIEELLQDIKQFS